VLVDNNPDIKVICGDCLDVMAFMDAESVDSIVTDPPYGLSFMGKDWDHGVPGTHFWKEALRVAKPGTHLLAFGGTRTFHRLVVAIEDAGWEIRDTIMWVYGEGFPKSHDVSKAIDKMAGAKRKIVCDNPNARPNSQPKYSLDGKNKNFQINVQPITAPATPEAKQWEGWGTALKPAWEPVIVARKPLEGTVANNVLKWGTGAININGCRIGNEVRENPQAGFIRRGRTDEEVFFGVDKYKPKGTVQTIGRFPANLIHDGSDEVLELFPYTKSGSINGTYNNTIMAQSNGNRNGKPIHLEFTGDEGSAARFFYCAKASKSERNAGLDGIEEKQRDLSRNAQQPSMNGGEGNPYNRGVKPVFNHHPTVKPIALMRYLVRLVTPPNGIVLDPFCGSGSTGVAAVLEGFRFIGIDISEEYCEIAKHRIDYAIKEKEKQRTLF